MSGTGRYKVEMLEMLDVKTIVKEKLTPYGEETIRRYFKNGIFFAHNRRNNVANLSYRGSVIVRYQCMTKLQRIIKKRVAIEKLGNRLDKASGFEDEFIVEKLKKNESIENIVNSLVKKIVEGEKM